MSRHFTKRLTQALSALLLTSLLGGLLAIGPAWGQESGGQVVSGQVTSEEGESLPGVNVVVQGTEIGTATNAQGNYSVEVPNPDTDVLVFSYVGFITHEEPVEGRSTIDVTLSQDTELLDEVVVVGYGTEERADVTGSISSVSAEDIEREPVSDFTEAIIGKVPGVNISRGGWQPSDGTEIRIRGERSLTASNDPLLVVDGAPWSGGTLHDIPPNSIESVQVLKGPSATAIYGSRGANGVIQVTTKRGSEGATQVAYSASVAAQAPYKQLDQMSTEQWVAMKQEARRTDNLPDGVEDVLNSPELRGYEAGVNTDWQDLVLQTGIQNRHELRVSGGSENTQFVIAPSFFDQTGAIDGVHFRRYSAQGDIRHQFSDRFEANLSFIGSQTNSADNFARQGLGGNLDQRDVDDDDIALINAFLVPPVGSPYDDEGNLVFMPTNDNIATNPLSEIDNVISEYQTTRLFGTAQVQYNLSSSFHYRAEFSPDIRYRRWGAFYGTETRLVSGGDPQASQAEDRQFHYTFNNILRYDKTLGSHSVNATGLYSFERQGNETLAALVQGLPYNSLYYGLGTAEEVSSLGSSWSEWNLHSFMGRVNYIFDDTYMLTATARYDGSSRLAEGNKWTLFPSVALGWRLSNESFMDPLDGVVSDLKLRAEYGRSGNTAIDPYGTFGSLQQEVYVFGDGGTVGFEPSDLSNPTLGWEITDQYNVGLDFGLLDNRVTGTADFYIQNTSDLLLTRLLPPSSGPDDILDNVGETRSTGFDASLSTINIESGDFRWTTDFTFSMNRTEIVDLFGEGEDDVGNEWFIGEPISVFYDYEFDGIWQQEQAEEADAYGQEPGDIRVVDQNNDGAINDEDRVILGTPRPDWSGGLTSSFRYRNVDFSFVVNTEQGRMIENGYLSMAANNLDGRFNNLDINYWTPDNPSNEFPRPRPGDTPLYGGSLPYVDASYVRVQNVTLGYRVPSGLTEAMGARSLRLYATVRNPYVFVQSDRFIGYDPDGSVNPAQAPSYRTFLFGVDLRF